MENKNNEQNRYIEYYEFNDEEIIQININEFYEFTKHFDDHDPDHINKILLMRNNLVNMMDTYLKKFNNPLIIKEFYKLLNDAKNKSIKNGKINKYNQYMNEIRVIQEYKGMKEKLAEKLAKQLFYLFKNSGDVSI